MHEYRCDERLKAKAVLFFFLLFFKKAMGERNCSRARRDMAQAALFVALLDTASAFTAPAPHATRHMSFATSSAMPRDADAKPLTTTSSYTDGHQEASSLSLALHTSTLDPLHVSSLSLWFRQTRTCCAKWRQSLLAATPLSFQGLQGSGRAASYHRAASVPARQPRCDCVRATLGANGGAASERACTTT
jgi:hypothetical protein